MEEGRGTTLEDERWFTHEEGAELEADEVRAEEVRDAEGVAAETVKPARSPRVPTKRSSTAKKPMSYAVAGVDISSGDRTKQRSKMLAR